MNSIEKALETLISEFGSDLEFTADIQAKKYIRWAVLQILSKQSKKYNSYDALLVKRGSDLGNQLQWAPEITIEVFRELKIKRILVPPEITPRSYIIKSVLGSFIQGGYDVGWYLEEKEFIMTLSSQK